MSDSVKQAINNFIKDTSIKPLNKFTRGFAYQDLMFTGKRYLNKTHNVTNTTIGEGFVTLCFIEEEYFGLRFKICLKETFFKDDKKQTKIHNLRVTLKRFVKLMRLESVKLLLNNDEHDVNMTERTLRLIAIAIIKAISTSEYGIGINNEVDKINACKEYYFTGEETAYDRFLDAIGFKRFPVNIFLE